MSGSSGRLGIRLGRGRPRRVFSAAAVATALLASCGLGAGRAPTGIHLAVTQDFGSRLVGSPRAPRVRGQETVMSLLMRNDTVRTRFGGGFVQSINGHAGGTRNGQPIDWFYYVNGVEASKGAADTNVHPGDHVWWDLHDWSATQDIPAVVGSFPEPFLNGITGKRLPVRVECAVVGSDPCRTVTARLRKLGVPAALAAIGPGNEPKSLHVLVGPWRAMSAQPGARGIESGPRASGVYARFSTDGGTLTLLDQRGHAARTLAAGAGLLAATRYAGAVPVWVVTGTDDAGVDLAAHALSESVLHNRFAVALPPAGAPLPVPRGSA